MEPFNATEVNEIPQVFTSLGNLVQEIILKYSSAVAIFRVYNCSADVDQIVELAVHAGPLPERHELITRFTTDIQAANTWYIDER